MTVHPLRSSSPAAIPTAAPSGPAVETPAPFSNPLTAKCADATLAAYGVINRAERALYAAEYALDEVNRQQKLLDQARRQLTAAIKELRDAMPVVNGMAHAFMERMPKA